MAASSWMHESLLSYLTWKLAMANLVPKSALLKPRSDPQNFADIYISTLRPKVINSGVARQIREGTRRLSTLGRAKPRQRKRSLVAFLGSAPRLMMKKEIYVSYPNWKKRKRKPEDGMDARVRSSVRYTRGKKHPRLTHPQVVTLCGLC